MIEVAVTDGGGGLLQRLEAWAGIHAPDMRVTEVTIGGLLASGTRNPDVVLLDATDRPGADPVSDVQRLQEAGLRPLAITHNAGATFSAALLATGACVLVGREQDPGGLAIAIRTAASGVCPLSVRHGRPTLSEREESVLRAYGSGLTLDTAARQIGISLSSAKTYLQRVKSKYRQVGRAADTKLDLARRLAEDFGGN